MVSGSGEQREYFHVDDWVHLRYQPLDAATFSARQQQLGGSGNPDCELALQLHTLSSQGAALLSSIRKQQSEIAQYLSLIDRKIELLVQAHSAGRPQLPQHPNREVLLSAATIRLKVSEALAVDSGVALQLVLFPERLCIDSCARVSACQARSDGDYMLEFALEWLPEAIREALFRHTLSRQTALRRQQREREQAAPSGR